ncbi:hypothetical protein F5Y09DRAFT_330047 [Xylaria sp. FL1042]|nr:hypothetical protein F5Y09DRAFT_330047 [Xylaria sp. FL1042]
MACLKRRSIDLSGELGYVNHCFNGPSYLASVPRSTRSSRLPPPLHVALLHRLSALGVPLSLPLIQPLEARVSCALSHRVTTLSRCSCWGLFLFFSPCPGLSFCLGFACPVLESGSLSVTFGEYASAPCYSPVFSFHQADTASARESKHTHTEREPNLLSILFPVTSGETSHDNSIRRGPMAGDIPGLTPLRPGHANETSVEMETENNALMSTPHAGAPSSILFGTADHSRPLTRSTRKDYFNSILVEDLPDQSQTQNRLRLATTRNGASATITSHLEDAPDIDYGPTEADGEESHERDLEGLEDQIEYTEPQNEESEENGHPIVGGLRVPRRSNRLRAKNRTTREPSPSTALIVSSNNKNKSSNRIHKRRRTNVAKPNLGAGPLRRSARLAKPLDIFHKYPELPPELRLMIWEAAIEPRLIYICNRSSVLEHAHNFGIQNKLPTWFMACQTSVYVAKHCYRKLFGQNGMAFLSSLGSPLRAQDINPLVDIVIFEPCHNGCRGYYCAQQYSWEDRAAVRRLAVQIDSPHLPTASEPGWVTISRSWQNVETLFMMKPAVKGLNQSDKAMIRIKEGDHEMSLRKLFETWKKGPGQSLKLKTLEFVRVVEQEPETKNIQDRYRSVEDRKTGLVEDIVLG